MGSDGARRLLTVRDIRLEEIPFEFCGKTYMLRCNMNVLADVQEVYGGQIMDAVTGGRLTKSLLEFLAAMLNDYAEEMGWPERYTSRNVGRKLSPKDVSTLDIMGMVTRAVAPPSSVSGADPEEQVPETGAEYPGDSGN